MPDLEKVNIARKALGLEPIDKLVTPETIEEKKDPVLPTEKPKEGEADPKNPTPNPPPVTGELTNEQLIELLGARGIKISSLDDLKQKDPQKTKEEIAEEEEAEKLTFGLTKGLFKKADYESFITDNNAKVELVFNQFSAEAIADDPTLTPEEIRIEFEEKYGLDAEVGTRKHKRGAKEIEVISRELMKAKHPKIYEAENKYSSFKQNSHAEAEYNKNIIAKTPEYKSNVEEAFSIARKISEGIELPDEAVTELKNIFLDPKFAEAQIRSGFTKEQIVQQVKAGLISKNLPFVLQRNADLAVIAHKAGVKGIIPVGSEKRNEDPNKPKLTPNQQQEYDKYLAAQPKPISALN